MFEIKVQNGNQVFLIGRYDAAQTEKVESVLEYITDNCIFDFKDLEYISSAGLGQLVKIYSKLKSLNKSIVLVNMNKHVSEVFKYAGLDKVFSIG